MEEDPTPLPNQCILTQRIEPKKSFCRFYLRGLCILKAVDCNFAHGVHDLKYQPIKEGQIVEYDYLKDTDFTQKKAIKGPRIYMHLYEFQQVKKFTLEQINEDRNIRTQIRRELHLKMFSEFMQLLEWSYPQIELNEQFLVQQYTRVGFNKLMTRIKFSHLTDYLCDRPGSKYFKDTVGKVSIIRKRAQQEAIQAYYRNLYLKTIKQSEKIMQEGDIKKLLFQHVRVDLGVPPLNTVLKESKASFSDFIKYLLGEDKELGIKVEAGPAEILAKAKEYLSKEQQKEQHTQLIEWNDVYKHLSKELKLNNGNVLNKIKPSLAAEGYYFMFFPMIQFILNTNSNAKKDYSKINPCGCQYTEPFTDHQIFAEAMNWAEQLKQGESIDINDWESLMACAPHIINSQVLGVDLEGRLRKNGYIQMIQLNNGANTFLIDIYQMDLNGDIDTFEQTKRILRNVMTNQKVLKIFHDCRHDSLALHEFTKTCIKNVFDTSAVQTYKNQLALYQNAFLDVSPEKSMKQVISQANNIKTPGLNQILKKYEAPHGINKNKDLFHKMWSQGKTGLFDRRPMDPEYREYCIKDVLDLPFVQKRMCEDVKMLDLQLAQWISSQYARYGYLSTQQGQNP